MLKRGMKKRVSKVEYFNNFAKILEDSFAKLWVTSGKKYSEKSNWLKKIIIKTQRKIFGVTNER